MWLMEYFSTAYAVTHSRTDVANEESARVTTPMSTATAERLALCHLFRYSAAITSEEEYRDGKL